MVLSKFEETNKLKHSITNINIAQNEMYNLTFNLVDVDVIPELELIRNVFYQKSNQLKILENTYSKMDVLYKKSFFQSFFLGYLKKNQINSLMIDRKRITSYFESFYKYQNLKIYNFNLYKSEKYLKEVKLLSNDLITARNLNFKLYRLISNNFEITSSLMAQKSNTFFSILMLATLSFFLAMKYIAYKRISSENDKKDNEIKNKIKEIRKKDLVIFEQSKLASMGEMVGSIAHQWRQPLNAIFGSMQLLELDYKDKLVDEKYIKLFLEDNKKIINHMSDTIDNFRNFFRTDKKMKQFYLKNSLEHALSLIKSLLDEQSIEVHIHCDKRVIIHGIETEFHQVLLNILNNAKDEFQKKNVYTGFIDICIFCELNTINIYIKDNAGGVPEEIIGRIFEPYYTTKEEGKGTGIGLYMSKMIIENTFGGELIAYNENNGAVFQISLIKLIE